MSKVEVEEHELANSRKLGGLVKAIMGDPEARKLMLQAHKKVDPNASIPEIDQVNTVEAATAAVRKEFADFRAEQIKKEADAAEAARLSGLKSKWDQGRDALRSKNYTADGIAAVEKLMEERGIGDHADAAIIFERLNPPATPISSNPNSFNFFAPSGNKGEEDLVKKLMDSRGEDVGVLDTMVGQTLTEIRGR